MLFRDATILQYIDILQYSLLQYNTICLSIFCTLQYIVNMLQLFCHPSCKNSIITLTAKMTETLVTRNIQYDFMFLLSFFASFKDMICSFINLTTYCNMAIYCNTLKGNMQYGIDLYCYISNAFQASSTWI